MSTKTCTGPKYRFFLPLWGKIRWVSSEIRIGKQQQLFIRAATVAVCGVTLQAADAVWGEWPQEAGSVQAQSGVSDSRRRARCQFDLTRVCELGASEVVRLTDNFHSVSLSNHALCGLNHVSRKVISLEMLYLYSSQTFCHLFVVEIRCLCSSTRTLFLLLCHCWFT